MRFLNRYTNYYIPNSLGNRFRNRRFKMFKELLDSYNGSLVRILDVGGTQLYWENRGCLGKEGVEITILNEYQEPADYVNIHSIVGTATDLSRYKDNSFDITFSNSVIEHLGNWQNIESMAREVQRVGKSYYVQTPNKYFPIEAHFLLPFFQFLPFRLKFFLLTRTRLSKGRSIYKKKAFRLLKEIKLLSKKDLQKLFPEAKIKSEKFLGFRKSFIVYKFDKN